MNISSISASTPASPMVTGAPKSSDSNAGDNSNSSVSSYQPPPRPPLPPGQGVRVDQLA